MGMLVTSIAFLTTQAAKMSAGMTVHGPMNVTAMRRGWIITIERLSTSG